MIYLPLHDTNCSSLYLSSPRTQKGELRTTIPVLYIYHIDVLKGRRNNITDHNGKNTFCELSCFPLNLTKIITCSDTKYLLANRIFISSLFDQGLFDNPGGLCLGQA